LKNIEYCKKTSRQNMGTGDGRVTCQLCGYRPLQTNMAIEGHLVRHRLNEKFDFFVQLHLQIKDDNYSLERILENNQSNLINKQLTLKRPEHKISLNTTETQTDSQETLNDTESNNELEESIAVQDQDSSLYYSLEESQRKSPNANKKNPPRNKTKNGVDFGVQFSYSPRIESKKVQTNIHNLDQESKTSQTNLLQVNTSSQTNKRLELITKSVQTCYSRAQQSTQTEQTSFLTEATTQYETDELINASTRPNSPVLTDEISDDDTFCNSEFDGSVAQPNKPFNESISKLQGEDFLSAYISHLNNKGSNDDILEEELSSDYSFSSPPSKRINLNIQHINYKFVSKRKSEDLIESIEKASKASEVSDYCESLEDIQQYITDTDKKDQKQGDKESFLKSLNLTEKSPVKKLKKISSLDNYSKYRTPKVRVDIKKLFFPTVTTVFIDEHDGTNHCRDLNRRKIAAMKTNFIDDHANINHCRDLERQKIPAVKTVENSVTESLNVDGEIIIITDSESDGEEQYTDGEKSVDVPEPSTTHEPAKNPEAFHCPVCNEKFPSKGHTQSHIITAHKDLKLAEVQECLRHMNNDSNYYLGKSLRRRKSVDYSEKSKYS